MTEIYEEHSRKSGGGDDAQEKDVLRSGDEEEADEVSPRLREEEQLYDDARKSPLVRGSAQQATVATAASVVADEGDADDEEATTPPPPAAAEEAEATEEMPTSELPPSPLLARREGENESRRDVESLHDHASMQPSPPCDEDRRAWAASRGGHSDNGVDGREDPSATTNNQMTVPLLANPTDDGGLIQQRSENGWRATIHL